MSLYIQKVKLWKSPNIGILGVFVGKFQFGSNLTQKMSLYYSILDTFVLKIDISQFPSFYPHSVTYFTKE